MEAVEEKDGDLRITTDNGGLFLLADQETSLSSYEGPAPAGLGGVETSSHIMAWYGPVALSYPGQAHAGHIMVLDPAQKTPTRSDLAVMLHTAQGNPEGSRYKPASGTGSLIPCRLRCGKTLPSAAGMSR